MAFEILTGKFNTVFKRLRGMGKLSEKDVKDAMRDVRLALLEADVNFRIVKEFVASVAEKAIGDEVIKSLTPGQTVVKIVYDELTALLGGAEAKLTFSGKPPTVYLLAGLQGAGKTSAAGKLAAHLTRQGKKPLLAALDIYRPAAIEQLRVVGRSINVPVFAAGTDVPPPEIALAAIEEARGKLRDVVILDTAGRLHIDETMMEELRAVKTAANPQEVLLVVDSMTGQDAVNVAGAFHESLGVDGVILTKLDGDARGGAAISVRKATGRPIKFAATGERPDALEPFYPDRMASRILGMGDVLTMVEKAQDAIDQESARELERKIRKNEFDLEDFLAQMQQIRKMGPLKNLLNMIPGLAGAEIASVDVDEKALAHIEAIIRSMTPAERRSPGILNGSRRRRVANGSGRNIQEVNQLLKRFEEMRRMMKQMTDMSRGRKGRFGGSFGLKM
ncbi:MAG: signal recognition particle protein [Clostridiales bacterium]|jgi:signal recognition particle subunit SRP54|nr:signal recognition particle protein [Clostridiales bacterium]